MISIKTGDLHPLPSLLGDTPLQPDGNRKDTFWIVKVL